MKTYRVLEQYRFPDHSILGPTGKISLSLSSQLKAQVCNELKQWAHSLQHETTEVVRACMNQRINQLRDLCDKETQHEINEIHVIRSKPQGTKDTKPVSKMSKLDTLIFDMALDGCTIVAIQENKDAPKKTCGYFPWKYEGMDANGKFPGGFKPVNEIIALMQDTAGGFSRTVISNALPCNRYKGWSTCRLCGCNNGSSEYVINNHAVPEGILHVMQKHKLPANLFSLVCEGKRVFYIAKKPFKKLAKDKK